MEPTDSPRRSGTVRLAAVGDILLTDGASDASPEGPPRRVGPELRRHLDGCDLVFGNLECTLPGRGETVATEPRVVAAPQAVESVLATTVAGAVTLANNHTFDCMAEGFHATRDLLDRLGVAWFGAGDCLDEAARAVFVEAAGARLALLAAVDHRSGPARFATQAGWGVAPLDVPRLVRAITRLRDEADHVIASVHWGEERLLIPSPRQIQQAHALVDAGASAVLGHHPHVVQGLEVYRGAPVIYSLGNFVACDVPFSDGDVMTWNRTERTGCLLVLDLGPGDACSVTQLPTFDSGETVEVESRGFGRRRIDRANRALVRGVTLRRYRREYFIVKTLKPALAHLRWSRLKRVRPATLRRALGGLSQARDAE